MTSVPILRQVPLFASLRDEELAAIAPLFSEQQVGRHEFVFFEGDPPRWVYIVVEGRIKLLKYSEEGKVVILHLLHPGEMFGGVAAFGRRPYPFSAQALIPSQVLRIAGPDFHEIMSQYPDVSDQVIRELATRLIEAHETMKHLAVERVEQRIAHVLLKLTRHEVEGRAGPLTIDLPLTRQDIAEMVGTTVETTIRVFSKWRRAGIVGSRDGKVVILDPERLDEIRLHGTG